MARRSQRQMVVNPRLDTIRDWSVVSDGVRGEVTIDDGIDRDPGVYIDSNTSDEIEPVTLERLEHLRRELEETEHETVIERGAEGVAGDNGIRLVFPFNGWLIRIPLSQLRVENVSMGAEAVENVSMGAEAVEVSFGNEIRYASGGSSMTILLEVVNPSTIQTSLPYQRSVDDPSDIRNMKSLPKSPKPLKPKSAKEPQRKITLPKV